jgi:hypothetical protein
MAMEHPNYEPGPDMTGTRFVKGKVFLHFFFSSSFSL